MDLTDRRTERSSPGQAPSVAAVMTIDPVCCTPQDDLETARRLMNAVGCSCLPVVEDKLNGQLLGTVSLRDIDTCVDDPRPSDEIRVQTVMKKPTAICSIAESCESVRRKMESRGARYLPVVDEWDCCIGIVTPSDLPWDQSSPRPTTAAPPPSAGEDRQRSTTREQRMDSSEVRH